MRAKKTVRRPSKKTVRKSLVRSSVRAMTRALKREHLSPRKTHKRPRPRPVTLAQVFRSRKEAPRLSYNKQQGDLEKLARQAARDPGLSRAERRRIVASISKLHRSRVNRYTTRYIVRDPLTNRTVKTPRKGKEYKITRQRVDNERGKIISERAYKSALSQRAYQTSILQFQTRFNCSRREAQEVYKAMRNLGYTPEQIRKIISPRIRKGRQIHKRWMKRKGYKRGVRKHGKTGRRENLKTH